MSTTSRPDASARSEEPQRRGLLAFIFVSSGERRLRAGWRLAIQVALQFIILLAGSATLLALVPGLLTDEASAFSPPALVISQIAALVSVTASVFLARRLLDRRSLQSLGLRPDRFAVRDFLAGMAITFVMMASIFAVEFALGWLQLDRFAWETESIASITVNVILFLFVCLLVGWNEELMSRGYHLQTLASGTTLGWGWILSSAVFGVLHLGNPHASWLAAAGIILAGLFLGYAYLKTGQLWLSIGLHTGWNFFEGVVFGFPVSGLPFYRLLHPFETGPDLWTGGLFGPEAGLVLVPALVIGFSLIHLLSAKGKVGAPSP